MNRSRCRSARIATRPGGLICKPRANTSGTGFEDADFSGHRDELAEEFTERTSRLGNGYVIDQDEHDPLAPVGVAGPRGAALVMPAK